MYTIAEGAGRKGTYMSRAGKNFSIYTSILEEQLEASLLSWRTKTNAEYYKYLKQEALMWRKNASMWVGTLNMHIVSWREKTMLGLWRLVSLG